MLISSSGAATDGPREKSLSGQTGLPVVHWFVIRRALSSSFLAIAVLAGCHANPKSGTQAPGSVTVYHVRGKVVSTDPASGIIVLDGDAIPGFMDAMTMPYQVKNPGIINTLHPGDTITANVLVSKSSTQTVLLDDIDIVAQAKRGNPQRDNPQRDNQGSKNR